MQDRRYVKSVLDTSLFSSSCVDLTCTMHGSRIEVIRIDFSLLSSHAHATAVPGHRNTRTHSAQPQKLVPSTDEGDNYSRW